MNYRKIYERHHGSIPKDKFGRTYEIHHLDGNHHNNSINNLLALTIQQHYDIHYEQGDWGACQRIGAKMKMVPAMIGQLSSLAQQKRVENGTHQWLLKNRIQTRPISDWELKNPIDYDAPLTAYQSAYLEFSRALALEVFCKKQLTL